MRRSAGRAVLAAATGHRRRAPAILVGETYLDATSGVTVRVLDSQPMVAGPIRFIVGSADGARPGERWLCTADELLEVTSHSRSLAPCPATARHDAILEAARDALSRTNRLLESGQGIVNSGEVGRLASTLRVIAEGLAAGGQGATPSFEQGETHLADARAQLEPVLEAGPAASAGAVARHHAQEGGVP